MLSNPFQGLVFNSQKYSHTSVNWYNTIAMKNRFISNSYYETDFGVSSAEGAGNTKIDFLKARQRRAFKKSICIMRTAAAL